MGVHDILIVFSISMWKFWVLEINCFSKIDEFINFEAVEDNMDEIDVVEENMIENVSDVNLIDDENNFDENIDDYYAFTNVNRSVEAAMQDYFIDFDYSQEANNYCPDDYYPGKEIIDQFKYSAKKVEDFKSTLLIMQGFGNTDSFYYVLLYTIQYQFKNKKNECDNDDELRKYIDNDQLYDALSAVKEKLSLDLDIQNFENQCFSVNNLLNKYGLFLRVYEMKDKFRYLIKQDSKKNFWEIYWAVSFVSSPAKGLRQPFCLTDIIWKPVKKSDDQ